MQSHAFPRRLTLIGATDITTGYAADSLFDATAVRDPWAEDCLSSLIDTLVNHDVCVFPVPSAGVPITEMNYPAVLTAAHARGMIDALEPGGEMLPSLSETHGAHQFEMFAEWLRQEEGGRLVNRRHAREWVRLHLSNPQIVGTNRAQVRRYEDEPIYQTSEFRALAASFCREDGERKLAYALNVFLRAHQYAAILPRSDARASVYFPHPLRRRAFAAFDDLREQQDYWSWGRCLAIAIRRRPDLRDVGWLMETTARLKEIVGREGAQWETLLSVEEGRIDPNARVIVEEIAAEARLPRTLRQSIEQRLKTLQDAQDSGTDVGLPLDEICGKAIKVSKGLFKYFAQFELPQVVAEALPSAFTEYPGLVGMNLR